MTQSTERRGVPQRLMQGRISARKLKQAPSLSSWSRRARIVLADLGDRDRIVRKAHGGRGQKSMWEMPAHIWRGTYGSRAAVFGPLSHEHGD